MATFGNERQRLETNGNGWKRMATFENEWKQTEIDGNHQLCEGNNVLPILKILHKKIRAKGMKFTSSLLLLKAILELSNSQILTKNLERGGNLAGKEPL